MSPDMWVRVESWFSAGVVVSYTDQCGVEYRGALLKRTDETPEFKASLRSLASPLSVLHDHPYSKLGRKALKRQVPAQVMYSWNTTDFPLTTDDMVCRRNGFVSDFEKRAVVETDFVGDSISLEYPCLGKRGRSAKYHAKLKLSVYHKELQNDLLTKPRKKTSRSPKKPKTKPKQRVTALPKSPTESSSFSYTPLSSPISKLDLSPSLIAHAQNCTIGLTPTSTVGLSSPLRLSTRADSSDSLCSSTEPSSRGSSLSPARQGLRPFSISLQRVPLPPSGAVITLE